MLWVSGLWGDLRPGRAGGKCVALDGGGCVFGIPHQIFWRFSKGYPSPQVPSIMGVMVTSYRGSNRCRGVHRFTTPRPPPAPPPPAPQPGGGGWGGGRGWFQDLIPSAQTLLSFVGGGMRQVSRQRPTSNLRREKGDPSLSFHKEGKWVTSTPKSVHS